MANRPYTDKPIAEEEPKIPEPSKAPSDFVEVDDALYCKTCGTEIELHECKCGKKGTKAYMDAHLENRMQKGGPALRNHARVRPVPIAKETPKSKPTPKPEPVNEPEPERSRMVEIPAPRKNIFDGKRRK